MLPRKGSSRSSSFSTAGHAQAPRCRQLRLWSIQSKSEASPGQGSLLMLELKERVQDARQMLCHPARNRSAVQGSKACFWLLKADLQIGPLSLQLQA